MKRNAQDGVAQLKAKIESKLGYIRYLKNRMHDPAPLVKEIDRRKAEIAKHQQAIEKLETALADIPAALERAQVDLKTLRIKLGSLEPKALTKEELMLRISKLQGLIETIKDQVSSEGADS